MQIPFSTIKSMNQEFVVQPQKDTSKILKNTRISLDFKGRGMNAVFTNLKSTF